MNEPPYLRKYLNLAGAVKEMRTTQKSYFADRTGDNLRKAKAAERLVDELLNRDPNVPEPPKTEQTNLFNA